MIQQKGGNGFAAFSNMLMIYIIYPPATIKCKKLTLSPIYVNFLLISPSEKMPQGSAHSVITYDHYSINLLEGSSSYKA